MRPGAVAKSGFYPAAPEAVRLMLTHLARPAAPKEGGLYREGDIAILDPCAGEGEALSILAEGLSISPTKVHAIELNSARADAVRVRLPEAKVVGPCSYFGTEISVKSFSLVYCNPPFDYDGTGTGTREEHAFVRRSYDLLAKDGILILVCPCHVIIGNQDFGTMVDSMFDDVEVYRFPDDHRPYKEVCLFGKKRTQQLDAYKARYEGSLGKLGWHDYEAHEYFKVEMLPALGEKKPLEWKTEQVPGRFNWDRQKVWTLVSSGLDRSVWTVPHAWAPRRFNKLALTDEEKAAALRSSPLWDYLQDPEPKELPTPWMLPAKNHTVMLMVSGLLDGVVPVKPPHVIRGVYFKKERKPVVATTENEESGKISTTETFAEEPVSKIRLIEVDEFGTPHLFEHRSDASGGEGDGDDSCEDDYGEDN